MKNRYKYTAQIRVNRHRQFLGYFDYGWTAAYAYDSYIINNNLEHTTNFMLKYTRR